MLDAICCNIPNFVSCFSWWITLQQRLKKVPEWVIELQIAIMDKK